MERFDLTRPGTRFIFLMALLLVSFLLISAIFGYQRQRALIHKMARSETRIVAGEVLEAMQRVKAPHAGMAGKEAAFHHQPEELQRLVNRITTPDKFLVKILPLDPGGKGYRRDEQELKLLRRLQAGKSDEEHLFMTQSGERGLLYLRPLKAEKECLTCHGSFDSAPDSVRALYSGESRIYGHGEKDFMGAVAVFMPMSELYDSVRRNVISSLFIMALPILLLVFALSIRERRG